MDYKKLIQYVLIFIASIAILTGCGGSSSDTKNSNELTTHNTTNNQIATREENNTESNNHTQQEQEVVKTKGYLIDSPLSGVTYECDGNVALTDDNGTFECIAPPVTFKIGNLTLGTLNTFTADSKVYPQDLLGLARTNYSNNRLKLLARFMQSLDDDGVINTKITITADIRNRLSTEQNFADMSESDIKALLSGIGKSLVNECEAVKHLGASVSCNSDGSYHVVSSPVSGGSGNNPHVSTITPIINKIHQKNFSYDSTNRVTKEDLGNGNYIEYTYDDSGNLISQKVVK